MMIVVDKAIHTCATHNTVTISGWPMKVKLMLSGRIKRLFSCAILGYSIRSDSANFTFACQPLIVAVS